MTNLNFGRPFMDFVGAIFVGAQAHSLIPKIIMQIY